MGNNKVNIFIWFFYKAGNKFRNFVFRKRLGKKEWSAKLIFSIMSFFDYFESMVYINTSETGIFDHYVPRLLLKRWRVAETGTDKGSIFCWSKSKNTIEKVAISSVAGETDWDLSHKGDLASDFVRKKLYSELLEDKASRIIKHINTSNDLELTFLEESTLATFLSHQIVRVPLFHISLLKFLSIGFEGGLITSLDLGDKEALVRKVANNEIGITYEQLLEGSKNIHLGSGKPQRSLLALVIATIISKKIYGGNLHILEVPPSSANEFVTSDNPVVFFDFDRQTTLRLVPWWEIGKKDFWIFMPISPKKAIFYCKSKRKDGSVERESEDLVQLLNFGQYLNCSNNVFSRNKNILQQHVRSYSKELKEQRKVLDVSPEEYKFLSSTEI